MSPKPSKRHFLIRLAETERMCGALRDLAGEEGDGVIACEATIRALLAAHDQAAAERLGRKAFRFLAPAGAEHLMVAAAIRVRGDAAQPLGARSSL